MMFRLCKRILAMVMTFIMVVGLIPVTMSHRALAAEDGATYVAACSAVNEAVCDVVYDAVNDDAHYDTTHDENYDDALSSDGDDGMYDEVAYTPYEPELPDYTTNESIPFGVLSGANGVFDVNFTFNIANAEVRFIIVDDSSDPAIPTTTMTGTSVTGIDENKFFRFKVIAPTGYHIEEVTHNNIQVPIVRPPNAKNYPTTFSGEFYVTADNNIYVEFEINEYDITFLFYDNRGIVFGGIVYDNMTDPFNPDDDEIEHDDPFIHIEHGTIFEFTAEANEGYHIESIIFIDSDGDEHTVDFDLPSNARNQPKTFTYYFAVTDNYEIAIDFTRNTYDVTFLFDEDRGGITGGEVANPSFPVPNNPIDDDDPKPIEYESHFRFRAAAEYGYHIQGITINSEPLPLNPPVGRNQPRVSTHTFFVERNNTIDVDFAINTYDITINSEGRGRIEIGSTTVISGQRRTVDHGDDLTLRIIPDFENGYLVSRIIVGANTVINLDTDSRYQEYDGYSTFTLRNVIADSSIRVIFDRPPSGVGFESDYFTFSRNGFIRDYIDDAGVHVFVFERGTSVEFRPMAPQYLQVRLNQQNLIGTLASPARILTTTNINSIHVNTTFGGWNNANNVVHVPLERPIRIVIDITPPVVTPLSQTFWGNEHQGATVYVRATDLGAGVSSVRHSADISDFNLGTFINPRGGAATLYNCYTCDVLNCLCAIFDGIYSFTLPPPEPPANPEDRVDCQRVPHFIWAWDRAENRSVFHRIYIGTDTIAPEITDIHFDLTPDSTTPDSILNFLDFGTFSNSSVNVTVTAVDPPSAGGLFSGINEFVLYMNGVPLNIEPIEVRPLSQNRASATFTIDLRENTHISGVISARVTDNAGNVSSRVFPSSVNPNILHDKLTLDNLPPNITIETPPAVHVDPYTGNKWYPHDIYIPITVTASGAGISSVQIKINGTPILVDIDGKAIDTDFSQGFTRDESFVIGTTQGVIDSDGAFLIEVTVFDNSGNESLPTNDKVFRDTDTPYITGFSFSPIGNQDSDPNYLGVEITDYGFYFSEPTIVTIYAADDDGPSAGIRSITYYTLDEHGLVSDNSTIETANDRISFLIPEGFRGHIFAGVTDNVYNATMPGYFVSPHGIIIEDSSRHSQEQHIFFNVPTTSFVDINDLNLYAEDVSVQITVVDRFSGLRYVEWSVTSPNDTGNNQIGSLSLNNSGHYVEQVISGWSISQMDRNLVTAMTNTIVVRNNSNAIEVSVKITDRAGNTSEETIMFSIDKTDPTIEVTFDNNNPDSVFANHFNAPRTATITITERNFDPQDVIIFVDSMSIGPVPEVSAWTSAIDAANPDLSRHTATITFSEDGEYSFTIDYSDNAGNPAQTFTADEFIVDQTAPEITVFYDNNFAQNINYFDAERIATISIFERNFTEGRVTITGTATLDGNPVEFPQLSTWESFGDMHEATLHFSEDAYYNFTVEVTDMAGNVAQFYTADSFHIVQTMPQLRADNRAHRSIISVYTEPMDIEPAIVLEFYELNFSHIVYTIAGYNYTESGENNGIAIFELEITDGGRGQIYEPYITLPLSMFRYDGVYELRATAFDLAGNSSEEIVHTYVVMRDVDMMAYIHRNDLEAFNGIGKQAINVPDIPITIYTIRDASFSLSIGEVVLAGGDYHDVAEEIAVGVMKNTVTIPNSFIARTFSENDQIYHLPINVSKNPVRTVGHLVINNVTPSGIFGSNLRSGMGFYGVSEQVIHVINLSDGIDVNATSVRVNGYIVDFVYDADAGTIAFLLEESEAFGHPWAGHQIRVTLIDTAGNEFAMAELYNIFVGSWIMRYWIFVTLASMIFIGAASFLAYRVMRIREKKLAER